MEARETRVEGQRGLKEEKKYVAKRENVGTASLSRVPEQHCGKNAVDDRQRVQKQEVAE